MNQNVAKKDKSLLWSLAGLLGFVAFLFFPQVFNDGDTYLHVALGQWILNHHAIPYQESFAYTALGKPWVAHEWLAEALSAFFYQLAGWNGVAIFYGAAFALLLWLLASHLSRVLNSLQLIITLVLIVCCISPHLLARPHIMILPIMELWTAQLMFARAQNRVPSLWWVLLITLWANLHGSFIFGIALIAPCALEALLEAKEQKFKTLYDWGIFFAAALLASFINPYGWHAAMAPLLTMHMTQLGALNEWKAADFSTLQPLEISVLAVLYVCFSYGVRIPLMRLLMLLLLLHQSLQHLRFEMQLSVVGALLLAEPLAKGFETYSAPGILKATRPSTKSISYLIIGVVLLTGIRLCNPLPLERPDNITSPVSAINHVPEALRDKPVLNENAFGAYMIFKHLHPFIDSRVDLYGDIFFGNYMEMMTPNRARLEQTIKDYHVQWAIFETDTPIVKVMDTLPGWHCYYADKIAVIYVQNEQPK